jgi:hypothetical protein
MKLEAGEVGAPGQCAAVVHENIYRIGGPPARRGTGPMGTQEGVNREASFS